MVKLSGETIYLAALERADCRKLYEDFEFDFENQTETLHIGQSVEKSDDWYEDIQKSMFEKHIRLGIFKMNGDVIGDVALQDIDWQNRSCSLGMGMAKIENRNRGYGKQAVKLMLEYAFNNLGLERVTASTLDINISAQKSLEKLGFTLEGRERKAVIIGGARRDRLSYAMLREDYQSKK